jgi:chromosome segregation ATPase
MGSVKSTAGAYKDQSIMLESRVQELISVNSRLEQELGSAKTEIEKYKIEKEHFEHQLQAVEEKLYEYEVNGGSPGAVLSSAALGEELQDDTANLTARIQKLEKENDSLRKMKVMNTVPDASLFGDTKALEEKIQTLELLLEDANQAKTKYEQDYLETYQQVVKLESEKRKASSSNDSQSIINTLRAKATNFEQENSLLKKKIAGFEVQIADLQGELEGYKANCKIG